MLDADRMMMTMIINERRKRPVVHPNFQSYSSALDQLYRKVEMQQFLS